MSSAPAPPPDSIIRPVQAGEIPQLIRLQVGDLPNSVAERFGDTFLRLYYESLLREPRFFCDGFFWESRLAGFMVYSSDTRGVFRRVVRANLVAYLAAVTRGLLSKPRRIVALVRVVPWIVLHPREPAADIDAELISFAVAAGFRRSSRFFQQTGRSVADELLSNALRVLAGDGAPNVKAFTKSGADGRTISRLFLRHGFTPLRRFKRFGVESEVVVRNLEPPEPDTKNGRELSVPGRS